MAEARLPLAALVLTMNLTVALEVGTLFILSSRNSLTQILLMGCPKVLPLILQLHISGKPVVSEMDEFPENF